MEAQTNSSRKQIKLFKTRDGREINDKTQAEGMPEMKNLRI